MAALAISGVINLHFQSRKRPTRLYVPPKIKPLAVSPLIPARSLSRANLLTPLAHGHSHDHHHHGHHHYHDHEHDHDGYQGLVLRFARFTGWAQLADLLREHLVMCCVSMALLLVAAVCPYVVPARTVRPLQNLFIAVAFPLVGVSG
jgi:Zn2+/Cd2+-exporting ATPase